MRPVQISLQVLETMGALQPVGVSELARALGLPKTTVQRALASLHEAGWIEVREAATAKWSLTLKALLTFGRAMQVEHRLRSTALPEMEYLRRETGETTFLAIRHERSMVLVERIDGLKPLKNFWPIGSATQLHTLSLGKAVLAFLPPEEIEAYLAGRLARRTPHTMVDPDELRVDLQAARRQGYATALRSNWLTENAVGAPIFRVREGGPFAAISISAPVERLGDAEIARWGPMLVDAARRVSEGLQQGRSRLRVVG
jgi:IclR family transcriptional regulator, acetate operon repressor